jgi:hypothetical protein
MADAPAAPVAGLSPWLITLRRSWIALEAVRHLGWFLFGVGLLAALSMPVLLLEGGSRWYLSVVGIEAWGAGVAAAAHLGWLVARYRPRRFARLLEDRLGRRDNLFVTLFEWENFPEVCSGSRELFAALADRGREAALAVHAFHLVGLRELLVPFLGALGIATAFFASHAWFGSPVPGLAGATAGADSLYYRIRAVPPGYTRMAALDHASSSCDAIFPQGSEVYFRAFFQVPPVFARMNDGEVPMGLMPCPDSDTCFQTAFRLDSTRNLLLLASNRPPLRCTLQALPDAPPSAQIQRRDEGPASLERGLAANVSASDDYGLGTVSLEYRINGVPGARSLLAEGKRNVRHAFSTDLAVDSRVLPLQPGDQVELWLEARDQAPVGEGQVGHSEVLRWDATSALQAAMQDLLEREAALLWRWVDLLAALLESGTPPAWEPALGELQAVVVGWKRALTAESRVERRAAALVDAGLQRFGAGRTEGAEAFLEDLVWTWSRVVDEHLRGVVDLHREAVENGRARLRTLLSEARPEALDVRLEMARVRHHLEVIEALVASFAPGLEGPGAIAGPRSEDLDLADWVSRLDAGEQLVEQGDWQGLSRHLAGMLAADAWEDARAAQGADLDPAWSQAVRALQKRVRPLLERQGAVVRGTEELLSDQERRLADWVREHLPSLAGEMDLLFRKLNRAVGRIPISDVIEDEFGTLKRLQVLLESMRDDWRSSRHRALRSGLGELSDTLALLRNDFYLNDLNATPLQRTITLAESMAALLERVERSRASGLDGRDREILEGWRLEQKDLHADLRGLRESFSRAAREHPEAEVVGHLLRQGEGRAAQATERLAEGALEEAVIEGRSVEDLLQRLDTALQAASGTMSLARRMLVRATTDLRLSSSGAPARRVQDLIAPFLKTAVPQEYRDTAEHYYKMLLEE